MVFCYTAKCTGRCTRDLESDLAMVIPLRRKSLILIYGRVFSGVQVDACTKTGGLGRDDGQELGR